MPSKRQQVKEIQVKKYKQKYSKRVHINLRKQRSSETKRSYTG